MNREQLLNYYYRQYSHSPIVQKSSENASYHCKQHADKSKEVETVPIPSSLQLDQFATRRFARKNERSTIVETIITMKSSNSVHPCFLCIETEIG